MIFQATRTITTDQERSGFQSSGTLIEPLQQLRNAPPRVELANAESLRPGQEYVIRGKTVDMPVIKPAEILAGPQNQLTVVVDCSGSMKELNIKNILNRVEQQLAQAAEKPGEVKIIFMGVSDGGLAYTEADYGKPCLSITFRGEEWQKGMNDARTIVDETKGQRGSTPLFMIIENEKKESNVRNHQGVDQLLIYTDAIAADRSAGKYVQEMPETKIAEIEKSMESGSQMRLDLRFIRKESTETKKQLEDASIASVKSFAAASGGNVEYLDQQTISVAQGHVYDASQAVANSDEFQRVNEANRRAEEYPTIRANADGTIQIPRIERSEISGPATLKFPDFAVNVSESHTETHVYIDRSGSTRKIVCAGGSYEDVMTGVTRSLPAMQENAGGYTVRDMGRDEFGDRDDLFATFKNVVSRLESGEIRPGATISIITDFTNKIEPGTYNSDEYRDIVNQLHQHFNCKVKFFIYTVPTSPDKVVETTRQMQESFGRDMEITNIGPAQQLRPEQVVETIQRSTIDGDIPKPVLTVNYAGKGGRTVKKQYRIEGMSE